MNKRGCEKISYKLLIATGKMSMPISLQLNCGHARGAIRQLTTRQKNVDIHKRQTEFKTLFKRCKNFGLCESYFTSKSGRLSAFDRHCSTILLNWKKRWHPNESKQHYEQMFSIEKWKALLQCVKLVLKKRIAYKCSHTPKFFFLKEHII